MLQRNCWIYAWTGKQWKNREQAIPFGHTKLLYAASDQFESRGLSPGDRLYVTAVISGLLYLGGRIDVSKIVDQHSAARALGPLARDLWPAKEYVLGDLAKPDVFRPRLVVPNSILDGFWLEHREKGKSLIARKPNNHVDGQTLRTIRRLISGEESKLDALLD